MARAARLRGSGQGNVRGWGTDECVPWAGRTPPSRLEAQGDPADRAGGGSLDAWGLKPPEGASLRSP